MTAYKSLPLAPGRVAPKSLAFTYAVASVFFLNSSGIDPRQTMRVSEAINPWRRAHTTIINSFSHRFDVGTGCRKLLIRSSAATLHAWLVSCAVLWTGSARRRLLFLFGTAMLQIDWPGS